MIMHSRRVLIFFFLCDDCDQFANSCYEKSLNIVWVFTIHPTNTVTAPFYYKLWLTCVHVWVSMFIFINY